jgi:hypothetical protein
MAMGCRLTRAKQPANSKIGISLVQICISPLKFLHCSNKTNTLAMKFHLKTLVYTCKYLKTAKHPLPLALGGFCDEVGEVWI